MLDCHQKVMISTCLIFHHVLNLMKQKNTGLRFRFVNTRKKIKKLEKRRSARSSLSTFALVTFK